jgi:hypothetical protein
MACIVEPPVVTTSYNGSGLSGASDGAIKVYQKRKNEIQERRFFPERIRRKDVLVADMIDDYLARVTGADAELRELEAVRGQLEGSPCEQDAGDDHAVRAPVRRAQARRGAEAEPTQD